MNKKFLYKKWKKWKRPLLTYLEKKNCGKLIRSFPVLYGKSHKGFKEKDAMKNACDGVTAALEFIKTRN